MQVRDPVCGKLIHLADAVAAEEYDDWTYFFCSRFCHDRFKATPARHAGEAPVHGADIKARANDVAGG